MIIIHSIYGVFSFLWRSGVSRMLMWLFLFPGSVFNRAWAVLPASTVLPSIIPTSVCVAFVPPPKR